MMECFENLDDAILDSKKDYKIIVNNFYKNSNFYLINLINLVECSKTLAHLYLSKGNLAEKEKYDSMGNLALAKLNEYSN